MATGRRRAVVKGGAPRGGEGVLEEGRGQAEAEEDGADDAAQELRRHVGHEPLPPEPAPGPPRVGTPRGAAGALAVLGLVSRGVCQAGRARKDPARPGLTPRGFCPSPPSRLPVWPSSPARDEESGGDGRVEVASRDARGRVDEHGVAQPVAERGRGQPWSGRRVNSSMHRGGRNGAASKRWHRADGKCAGENSWEELRKTIGMKFNRLESNITGGDRIGIGSASEILEKCHSHKLSQHAVYWYIAWNRDRKMSLYLRFKGHTSNHRFIRASGLF